MKILISNFSLNEAEYELEKIIFERELPGCILENYVFTGDLSDYGKHLMDADYLLTSFVPLDSELISQAKNLRAVSVSATGYQIVDIDSLKKHEISLYNVSDYCTEEVVIHTVSMVLSLIRGLKKHNEHIRITGQWDSQWVEDATVPSALNVVIYGYGKIGKTTAAILRTLGMRVYVVSAHSKASCLLQDGVILVDDSKATQIGDIFINHQSAGAIKEHYFDIKWFKSLKRQPFFINTGRGVSVDEDGLRTALQDNLIRGAGLDVLESESPALKNDSLAAMDNVIITPHSAFYSQQSIKRLYTQACMNLVNHIKGLPDEKNIVVRGNK